MKVMVVDDNEQNLYLLEVLLRSEKYEVVYARDGLEALEHLKKGSFGLIISDILMPRMDGFQLCKECKVDPRLKYIPFIFYTATYTDQKDEEFALSLGADRFIAKPMEPQRFLTTIREVIKENEKGALTAKESLIKDEELYLVEYNKRLIQKLEKKMLDLEMAHKTLAESEKKYRTLVTQSPDGIFIVDLQGTFLAVNKSMCERLKYSEEEFLSMKIWDIVPEKYVDLHKKRLADILRGEAPNEAAEYVVRGKDEKMHYIEVLSNPYLRENELIGFQGIARDITDRKRAEQALRESEEKYRVLVETSPDAITLFDLNLNILMVNRPALTLYGYEKQEEVIGKSILDYLVPEQFARAREDIEKILETGSMGSVEYTLRKKDGTLFPAELRASLILDNQKKPNAILCVSRDITERQRAEESLKQSEENARQVAQENAVMAEIGRIISSTLKIDEVYESFSKDVKKIIPFDRIVINILDTEKGTAKNVYIAGGGLQDRNINDIYPIEGSGNAEMVRTKSTLLIQTEDFNEYKDRFPMLLSTFQSGFRSIMDVPLFSKGKIIGGLLLRSLKPYAYTDKEVGLAERIGAHIAGAIANAQLYTERIQAEKERVALEEQLRQSQKMEAIGQLAGGIAHDFNNLLTVIQGYAQISLLDLQERDPLKANIEEIREAAKKAADLTRQLLAFSRKQILEMQVLDLNQVLQRLDKMLRRIIGEDVELVSFLSDVLGKVKADPGQMEQVIINLAVNARDAMLNGGKLTIETANVELDEGYAREHVAVQPGQYVMLSMSDTGVGMTPEVRERIFEPFFTTKEKGKGTGLGLSTVYGIVKQSGGNVWVYSEPGQGATFKIYLPQVNEPLEELKEKAVGEVPKGHETILVVEDEEIVRKLAVRILRKQGYKVLEAPDGGKALMLCEEFKEPVHLILTDVVMPGMSGRKVVDRLKEIHPEMKALFMSGYTDNAILLHGILEPGINFIQKPFAVDGLARKVREVLDK